MKICMYPYFSQQDKVEGKFLLDSDSGVRLYAYIARRLQELGHTVRFVLPMLLQIDKGMRIPAEVWTVPYRIAISNLDRRLQWEPQHLRAVAAWSDLVLTQHETIAFPLRCFGAKRVVIECGMAPGTAWPQTEPLHVLARKASEFVHCNSPQLAALVRGEGAEARVWQFGYDESIAEPQAVERDVDVLFNARASSTDYTNHRAFVEAMRNTLLRVAMTDPTRYLESTGGCPSDWLRRCDRTAYIRLLHRSRVVVGLVRNGYGGYAFREAVACGAVPVALMLPEYIGILGEEWPYYCTLDTVKDAVQRALAGGWPAELKAIVMARVAESSYAAAWEVARKDLGL